MRNLYIGIAVSAILAGCGGGGSTDSVSKTSSTAKLPLIILTASRLEINQVQTSELSWSVTDASYCTGNSLWSGNQPLTGNKIVTYAEGSQVYELTCVGPGGSSTKSITVIGKQPTLTFAGAWYPVSSESLKDGYAGGLANSFFNLIKIGDQDKLGLVAIGWGHKGDTSTSKETPNVLAALFEPDNNGLLTLATTKYIPDPKTYGAGSVIVSDLNKDSYQDIVFISHNETPILPNPTIIYYGSQKGTYSKKTTSDILSAHDSSLIEINGKSKILTSVVTGQPRNAYYEFVDGNLNPTYTPNMSYYNSYYWQFGNMSKAVVTNSKGEKAMVTAGGCSLPSSTCGNLSINVFNFDGYDISLGPPNQIIKPYLSTLPKYSTFTTSVGVGETHVYRVWSIDLNNDNNSDILSAQSMCCTSSTDFPVALQVLINKGDNTFVDKTETLNPEMPVSQNTLDFTPIFYDIDNSGIKTLFFSIISLSNTDRHSNYVILNDGTGKLYIALHKEFETVADNIFSLLLSKGYKFIISNPSKLWSMPRFIAVPQKDGSINFLAEVYNTVDVNPESGLKQASHLFVNVPFNYNPKTDFIDNISISDRNNSNKIRTWAGDDTITDKNAVTGTKIDGGLGKNKVTYSGTSTNYNVTKNNDGSYRVTNTANNIDDTLIRIHNIVFTDKTIILE